MSQGSPFARIVHEPRAGLATVVLLAFVALLPFEPIYNAPLIVLGVLGLLRLACRRVRLGSPENRFLCIAFLCIWLPMLASLPDAVNPSESIRKTASTCIYFLAGIYVTGAYTRFRELDRIIVGITAICLFWCLDALWQLHTGTDWFGVPYWEGEQLPGPWEGERLLGPFHVPGRIGYVLASLAPLFFEGIRRLSRRWPWGPILLVPFVMSIALSGSRWSWIVLAIGAAGYLLFLSARRPARPRRKPGRYAAISAVGALALVLAVYAWPGGPDRARNIFQPRTEPLAGLWSGDREQVERATSLRLSIWETAGRMFAGHWLNGVGPRGFRYAYREYRPEHDYYVNWHPNRLPPLSPHLLVLEIAVETGLLGLLGYLILAIAFLMWLRRLEPDPFSSVFPYALTLIVVLSPLTGHLTLHGTFSAGLIWCSIILTAGASAITAREATESMPIE